MNETNPTDGEAKVINKKINLVLTGRDGNVFGLIGAFIRQAKKEGWTPEEINRVTKEITSSDYDNALKTLMGYCVNGGEICME